MHLLHYICFIYHVFICKKKTKRAKHFLHLLQKMKKKQKKNHWLNPFTHPAIPLQEKISSVVTRKPELTAFVTAMGRVFEQVNTSLEMSLFDLVYS